MAEETKGPLLTCPACGGPVKLGDVTCPQCGVNIRTGETYETRVKRSRADELHPEHFAGRIGFGVTILFVLVLMGGFLYQQRVEKVLKKKEVLYRYLLRRSDELDALIAQGKKDQARAHGRQLIEDMKKVDSQIVIEDAPTTAQRDDPNATPKSLRQAEKTLLKNLILKTERRLAQLD
jgi:hypothetical protein